MSAVPSVLLVEDDAFTASLLSFVFQRQQFEVTCLADGQSVLDRLDTAEPASAVVLDILLPHVNGLEVLRRLRAHPKWQHTPVLVLSAKDQITDIEAALAAGADDYLVKPFDADELLARVKRCLARQAASL